ncbi:50S ribosomal protein L19e [Sulfolobus sp. E1]|nr:50S ribosomal protein L19e [Sulfolobus sp. E1]
MSDLFFQKRLAAELTGVGISKVRIAEGFESEVQDALTRSDVKKLIKEGKIIILSKTGISSGRAKEKRRNRRIKSEGKKEGSRKGRKGARARRKQLWVNRIRKIRQYLRWLRDHEVIDSHTYRELYLRAKGGSFKGVSDVRSTLIQMGKMRE